MTDPVSSASRQVLVTYEGSQAKGVTLGDNKTYPFSARIYKGDAEAGSTRRSIRSFFKKQVVVTTGSSGEKLVIKVDHLKKFLGLTDKQLDALLKKNDAHLDTLITKTYGQTTSELELLYKHRNATVDNPIHLKSKGIVYRTEAGKIRFAADKQLKLGQGGLKQIISFEKMASGKPSGSTKPLAFAQSLKSGDKKTIQDLEKEYKVGNQLFQAYKVQHKGGDKNNPFLKYHTFVSKASKSSGQPGILMEHCDRDLRKGLEDKNLTPAQKGEIYLNALRGVQFMHQHNLIHRDLKPENLLLNSKDQVKLIDFGFTMNANDDKQVSGTLDYLPVEVYESLSSKSNVGKTIKYQGDPTKLDSWALGIILHEMHFGAHPIPKISEKYQYGLASTIVKDMKAFKTPNVDTDPVAFAIDKLLQINPKDRWTVDQAIAHLEQVQTANGGVLAIGT